MNEENNNKSDQNIEASETISDWMIGLGIISVLGGLFFGSQKATRAGVAGLLAGGTIKAVNRINSDDKSDQRIS
jgi:hypothetical protein